MSTTCEELLPLIAARATGSIDPEERSAVESHLATCAACPGIVRDLDAAVGECAIAPRKAPDRAWDAILRAIEEDRAGSASGPLVRIVLRCTFCHAGLGRDAASFCASCLAPHHAECFEQHGRCAAPGCSETRTVAPAAVTSRTTRARRPRWPFVALAGIAVAGTVAALVPDRTPTEVAAMLAEVSEPGAVPAYPWDDLGDTEVGRRLLSQKVSLNLDDRSFEFAMQTMRELTGVEVRADERLHASRVNVHLRVRDLTLWNALALLARHLDDATFVVEPKGVAFVPRSALSGERARPWHARDVVADDAATVEIKRRLALQKLTVNFEETPLSEVVAFCQDITGQNVVFAPGVDRTQTVTLQVRDETFGAVLTALLSTVGLDYEVQNEVILVVKPRPPRTALALADRRVTLDLRGVTVPQLASTLAKQGIDVIATKETWAQKGTLSVIAKDETVATLIATIASSSSLHPWIANVPAAESGAVLVLDGLVPSVREAVTAPLPSFPGVATDVIEMRARLLRDVATRDRARKVPELPRDALLARERAVDLGAGTILSLLQRSKNIASARSRASRGRMEIRKVQKEMDKLRAERAEAPREHEKALAELGPGADERTQKERARLGREHEIKLARLESELQLAELRRDELLRQLGVIELDQQMMAKLEKGARMAEAERR